MVVHTLSSLTSPSHNSKSKANRGSFSPLVCRVATFGVPEQLAVHVGTYRVAPDIHPGV